MRPLFLSLAILLATCQQAQPPPLPNAAAEAPQPIWFICDGVDAPALLLFEREGENARMAEYDKPSGALVVRREFTLGDPEGAAGSIYTELRAYDAEQGFVHQINTGMLETPGAAYTPYVSSVELDQREIACRWLPRTRAIGFTGRRSFVVHEDADGDLIYTSYDFADAANAQRIELSDNGRSTTFSAEARGGEEMTRPDGVDFRFASEGGVAYVITLRREGAGRLDVERDGAVIQSEAVVAFQLGQAAAE
jgi:hypothetical protein